MEVETSCDDPQFMNMLETCLRGEIDEANNTLLGIVAELKGLKAKMQSQLRRRKDLKERITNMQENRLSITAVSNMHHRHVHEVSDQTELVMLNLDNDYKIMQLERQQHRGILKEYEKTWLDYHAKYEEFPAAKLRREARIKLQKLRIEEVLLEQRICEFEKISRQRGLVGWLRLRLKIVEFCRAVSNSRKLDLTIEDLHECVARRKEELSSVDRELALRARTREEEKSARALKLLEMPPPTVNFSYMRTIYGRRSKNGPVDGWKRNDENSIDTLSVDTMMLEEMCLSGEKPKAARRQNWDQVPYSWSDATEDASTAARSPCPSREQEEMERDEAASGMDENMGSEAIDSQPGEEAEEAEELEQEQAEEAPLPSSARRDKETVAEVRLGDGEDPPQKRAKLISDEDNAGAPMMGTTSARSERKRDQITNAAAGPRITKTVPVRYEASPMRNMERGNLKLSIGSKGSQLAGPSASQRASKADTSHYVSPMRKLNPNPASMFTPHRYDFSDSSHMSFCIDNMAGLKEDQISLYSGSARDLCECSNMSTPQRNREMDSAEEPNENVPSTRRTQNLPQFDLSNFLKNNPGRKLF